MSEETLLVSSMGKKSEKGKNGYSETDYVLDGERTESQTKFSPIALAELVEIDRALIARTEKAGEDYDEELEQAFGRVNVPCEFEEISKVQDRGQIDRLMQGLIEMIRERNPNEVVLDITYGFRTLPMVFFATVIHLDALDDIDVSGIYYGQFCGGDEGSPIIDMTYLHTLMEWYHAVNTFDRTGELRPIHALIEERKEDLFQDEDEENPTEISDFVKGLGGTSQNLDDGLPLKVGTAARSAFDEIETIDTNQFIGPEERFLEPLSDLLDRISVDSDVNDWNDISLSMDEVHRQREIVEFYAENDRYRVAVECARELFINRVIVENGSDLDNWLDHNGIRDEIETKLGKMYKDKDGALWSSLTQSRNWYAHSGFKTENSSVDINTAKDAALELCEKIDDDEYWSEII